MKKSAGSSPIASKEPVAPAPEPAPLSPFSDAESEAEPVELVPDSDGTATAGDVGLLWAVDYGESEHRELTTAEIAQELAAGTIDGQTLVWHDNMPDWLAIRDVKELSAHITAKLEPSRPELPKPPPSQQMVNAKTKGLPPAPKAAPLLPFGTPASQRSPASSRPPPPPKKQRAEPDDHEEVVTSARLIQDTPEPPARPATADVPAFPNPGPAAPAPAPPQMPAAFPTLRGVPGAGAPPALPADYVSTAHAAAAAPPQPAPPATAPAVVPPLATTLQAASSPTAPLMGAPLAPSAPFAPAANPVAVARPAADDVEWPQARSKKPLIIGALGLCAVIVVAWLLLSGSDETSAPASSETAPQATSVSEPAPPEPTPPPASPPSEPAPTSAEKAEPAPATPDAPPARTGAGKTGGGFADLFEQGAKGAR